MAVKWFVNQYSYLQVMRSAFEGDLTSSSATKFTLTSADNPNQKVIFFGTGFDFAGGNLVGGVVERMEVHKGGKLLCEVKSILQDAAVIWDAIQTFDPDQPFIDGVFQNYYGSNKRDVFVDNDFSGYLFGKGGDDELTGNGQDDLFDGGSGTNLLHGGTGADTFRFTTKNGVNVIDDYDASDIFRLSKGAFKGIGSNGVIDQDLIEFGVASASDTDTRFFLQSDGDLYYDSNGSGSGHRTLIAQFPNDAPEDFASFFVFA